MGLTVVAVCFTLIGSALASLYYWLVGTFSGGGWWQTILAIAQAFVGLLALVFLANNVVSTFEIKQRLDRLRDWDGRTSELVERAGQRVAEAEQQIAVAQQQIAAAEQITALNLQRADQMQELTKTLLIQAEEFRELRRQAGALPNPQDEENGRR
jgi:low affinity Fe/Cu permease